MLIITTSKHAHLTYNLLTKNQMKIEPLPNLQSQSFNFTGNTFDISQQRIICTQPNSTLWHVNSVEFKVEMSTSYKSKKVKDLKFGNLFSLKGNNLLSINPEDSIVLLNIV